MFFCARSAASNACFKFGNKFLSAKATACASVLAYLLTAAYAFAAAETA